VQRLVRPTSPQLEALEQPLELAHRHRQRRTRLALRPCKALALEPLVPEADPVAVPVERLDLGAPRVDGVQPPGAAAIAVVADAV
jgi:hypothetical protein